MEAKTSRYKKTVRIRLLRVEYLSKISTLTMTPFRTKPKDIEGICVSGVTSTIRPILFWLLHNL